MRELGPRIWAAIRQYARDDDHANDLLQDCWVQILKQLDGFKRPGSFGAWAVTVSKNVCRMKLRAEERAEVPLDSIGEVAGTGQDPEEDLRLRRQRQAIYAALGQLPDHERDAIVLRLLEERSAADTADCLGVSKAGARAMVLRGMSRLRRMEQMQELLLERMGAG